MVKKEEVVKLLEERGYGRFNEESWILGFAELRSICEIQAHLTETKYAGTDESDSWRIQIMYEFEKGIFVMSQRNIVENGVLLRDEFIEWDTNLRLFIERFRILSPNQLIFVGPEKEPMILNPGEHVNDIHPITGLCTKLTPLYGSWLKLLRSDLDELEELVKLLKKAKIELKPLVEDLTNE